MPGVRELPGRCIEFFLSTFGSNLGCAARFLSALSHLHSLCRWTLSASSHLGLCGLRGCTYRGRLPVPHRGCPVLEGEDPSGQNAGGGVSLPGHDRWFITQWCSASLQVVHAEASHPGQIVCRAIVVTPAGPLVHAETSPPGQILGVVTPARHFTSIGIPFALPSVKPMRNSLGSHSYCHQ